MGAGASSRTQYNRVRRVFVEPSSANAPRDATQPQLHVGYETRSRSCDTVHNNIQRQYLLSPPVPPCATSQHTPPVPTSPQSAPLHTPPSHAPPPPPPPPPSFHGSRRKARLDQQHRGPQFASNPPKDFHRTLSPKPQPQLQPPKSLRRVPKEPSDNEEEKFDGALSSKSSSFSQYRLQTRSALATAFSISSDSLLDKMIGCTPSVGKGGPSSGGAGKSYSIHWGKNQQGEDPDLPFEGDIAQQTANTLLKPMGYHLRNLHNNLCGKTSDIYTTSTVPPGHSCQPHRPEVSPGHGDAFSSSSSSSSSASIEVQAENHLSCGPAPEINCNEQVTSSPVSARLTAGLNSPSNRSSAFTTTPRIVFQSSHSITSSQNSRLSLPSPQASFLSPPYLSLDRTNRHKSQPLPLIPSHPTTCQNVESSESGVSALPEVQSASATKYSIDYQNEGFRKVVSFDHIEDFKKLQVYSVPKPTFAGSLDSNRTKNRYSDILPYDENRVKLNTSDYINASWIHSPTCCNQYIAAQAPIASTFAAFWEMIWQTKCRLIIVLGQLQEGKQAKIDRYWPTVHEKTKVYGNFVIKILSEDFNQETSTISRKIQLCNLQKPGRLHTLFHFQYTAWPDKQIPASTADIRHLMHTLSRLTMPNSGDTLLFPKPTTVHCSAGIGRTGTFCTVHICLQKLHSLMHSEHNSAPNHSGLFKTSSFPTSLPPIITPHKSPHLLPQTTAALPPLYLSTLQPPHQCTIDGSSSPPPATTTTSSTIANNNATTAILANVDVLSTVKRLREQRLNMVPEILQFLFCCFAVEDELVEHGYFNHDLYGILAETRQHMNWPPPPRNSCN
ncbi:protein-tyrosine phosphatase 1 [Pelomyxa schiedti]|nr:protein-tyrosine phosphatase 1 [Pelomyxa schiedti]